MPPAHLAEVVKTTLELWKAKKLTELDRYLAAYIKGNPKAVAASVCGAFLDPNYKGDMDRRSGKIANNSSRDHFEKYFPFRRVYV